MAAEKLTLDISWDVLDACNGFSMDMGGSVLKYIYIDQKEWVEPSKRKENCKGKLHLTIFTHEQFHDGTAGKFIKENALIKYGKDNKPPTVCGTGFWVSANEKTINKELDVRMHTLPETDCFISGLYYTIKHLPREEVLVKIPEQDKKVTISLLESSKKQFESISDMSYMLKLHATTDEMSFDPYFIEGSNKGPLGMDPDTFPCLVVMCGSGLGIMCLNEDGTYSVSSISTRAGKTWLGLGSLLTGGNNYENLMKLAENGSIKDVNMAYSDFIHKDSEKKLDDGNDYQKHLDKFEDWEETEPISVFDYGKAINKTLGDFQKEDLARTCLQTVIADLVCNVGIAANQKKVKHVYFTGGFVSHPLIRRYVFMKFVVRDFEQRVYLKDKEPIQCHFLKGGQHLGAFGALLNHKVKFFPFKDE